MISTDLPTKYKGRILVAQNLPALPSAVQKLSRLMEDSRSSVEQMAAVISQDQALTAKLLKMVNSPVYGFPGRIGNVQHGIVLLGINVIRSLIISSAVFDDMNKTMMGLWEHSLAASIAANVIARTLDMPHPEEYSVMGLLHDVGKVAFAMQLPEAKEEIDAMVRERDISFYEAEIQVLGFSHEKVNDWLCEQWNLPITLRDAITHHHDPMSANFYPEAAALTQLSDFCARLFESGFGGDDGIATLDPRALRLLGINHTHLGRLIDELSGKLFKNLS